MKKLLSFNGTDHVTEVKNTGNGFDVTIDGETFSFDAATLSQEKLLLQEGKSKTFSTVYRQGKKLFVDIDGLGIVVQKPVKTFSKEVVQSKDALDSPMPGKIIKVFCEVGDKVQEGDKIIVMEAMKMEHTLTAPRNGVIKEIKAQEGELVEGGVLLVELEENE